MEATTIDFTEAVKNRFPEVNNYGLFKAGKSFHGKFCFSKTQIPLQLWVKIIDFIK